MGGLTSAQLGFEAYTIVGVLTISLSFHLGGAAGLLLHTLLVAIPAIILDWWMSPTMGGNLARLAAHGHSEASMWCLMLFNLVATNCLVAGINAAFGTFDAPPRCDAALMLALACNLVLAEVAFTGGHFWLHRSVAGARFHVLHHLCQPCSLSSNLL